MRASVCRIFDSIGRLEGANAMDALLDRFAMGGFFRMAGEVRE